MREALRWKSIKNNFIVSAILVAIFGGVFAYKNQGDLLPYWPWALVALVVLTMFLLALEVLGRWRHRQIIQGHRLRWLTDLGFSVENVVDYWGYKGTYRSYFIRIYYNWESNLNRRGHELCIMVYYEPPLLENGELNVPLLEQANSAVTPAFWESHICRMNFEAAYLVNHTPITFLTSRGRIRKRLDRAVTTVIERKLMPISESAVHELVQSNPWIHGPSIDYFQMAYGAVE